MRHTVAIALMLLAVCGPLRADVPSVKQVAASLHILVLFSDGSVVALGENRSGQLGRPKAIGTQGPAKVALPLKATQVATAEDTSYALLEDGHVWAWGRGYSRQLGADLRGATDRDVPGMVPGLDHVASIAAGGNAAFAVLDDGTVRAWGELPKVLTGGREEYPGFARPVTVRGLERVASLSWNSGFGLALTTDGRVLAFGVNRGGALGLGTTGDAQPPTEIPTLRDVVAVAAVGASAAAVTKDGRVWTWGHNQQAGFGNGEHGDTSDDPQPTPQPVKGITDAVDVKAGTYGRHVIVRTRSGTLIGWGNSDWGQLGAGVSGDFQPAPRAITLPNVDEYWLGGNFSFARTRDGAFWFWGDRAGARPLLGKYVTQKVPARVPLEPLVSAP